MLAPMIHSWLSAGRVRKYQAPSTGINTIGAKKWAARWINTSRCGRSRPGNRLITRQATRADIVMAVMVRNSSEGQKLGLKNPAHTPCDSSHVPGVSCHERMPLIQNKLNHEANE